MSKKLYKKLMDKFGREHQINKIQEECLELSLAISNLKCQTKDKTKVIANMYEELADVKIVMEQAEEIFDKKKIKEAYENKINKLKNKYL